MDRRLVWSVAFAAAFVFLAQCAVRRQGAPAPSLASERAPSAAAAAPPPASASGAENATAAAASPSPAVKPDAAASAAFKDIVQPILARRCGPCHVPGGRMYGKMPFDDPEVVRSHEEGILRRIKEPADRAPLVAWLASSFR